LAATLYETCPLPLPLVPPVMVIQETVLDAVHAHPVAAVTPIVPLAADAPGVAPDGESTYVHGAASCVIVVVRPATVSVPVLEFVLVLAAME
jgi:hypothetical protein